MCRFSGGISQVNRFCNQSFSAFSRTESASLFIPQRRRVHRQIEQRQMVRQFVQQDGIHDARRQRGQVDHAAHVAVVDTLQRGDFTQ